MRIITAFVEVDRVVVVVVVVVVLIIIIVRWKMIKSIGNPRLKLKRFSV